MTNTQLNTALTTAIRQKLGTAADEVLDKASRVRLLAMDVDGVLSDGQIIYTDATTRHSNDQAEQSGAGLDDVVETKGFYVQDGVGLQALKRAGIATAIITGRSSQMVLRRAKELGIAHVVQGRDDKAHALADLAASLGLDLTECAYIGDDLPDVSAIQTAGLGVSVPNGTHLARLCADCVTEQSGGHGAVRELCELILLAQDRYWDFVQGYLK